MDYQEYLNWTYFGPHALDAEEFARMAELLEGVDLFVDVGASHGVYTYHASRIIESGEVLAVEADPERFSILLENVNRWTKGSDIAVRCLLAAVSDETDLRRGNTVPFFTTGTQISGGLFPVGERSDAYAPTEIPLITLDREISPGTRSLIKIDVEGAELRVLKGAIRLIESGQAKFLVELSWWGDRERGTSVWSTLRFLWDSGMGIERRLRSDYLLFPEPNGHKRAAMYLRVIPPLLPRYLFGRFAPYRLRRRYIRHQNQQRLARVEGLSNQN